MSGVRRLLLSAILGLVHVNVPLTPWSDGQVAQVRAKPDGLSHSVVTVSVESTVEWISTLDPDVDVGTLAGYRENPLLQVKSERDALLDVLGWDSGRLPPGQVYRRQFIQPGIYPYTDSAGHAGTVVVTAAVYLPLVLH